MVKTFHLHISRRELDFPGSGGAPVVIGAGSYCYKLFTQIELIACKVRDSGIQDASYRTSSPVPEGLRGYFRSWGKAALGTIIEPSLTAHPAASAGICAWKECLGRGIHRADKDPKPKRNWGLHRINARSRPRANCPTNHSCALSLHLQSGSQPNSSDHRQSHAPRVDW